MERRGIAERIDAKKAEIQQVKEDMERDAQESG